MNHEHKAEEKLYSCQGGCGQTRMTFKPFFCHSCFAKFKTYLGPKLPRAAVEVSVTGPTEDRMPPSGIGQYRRLLDGWASMLKNTG